MNQLSQYLPEGREIEFNDFYSIYPKKTEKVKAEDEWNKLSDIEKHSAYIDIPNRLANHSQWKTKSFIPSPRKFLLRKLWTDEIVKDKTKEEIQQDNEDGSIHSRLWTMLTQFYGNKFTSSYGLTMPKAWLSGLSNLTQIECQKILKHLATDQSEFIPDLPKINRIRRIGRDDWRTDKKLIGNPAQELTVKTELDKMKSILSNY